MDQFRKLHAKFWSESFWLPGNHSWDDLKNKDDGIYFPQVEDLVVPLYISVFISLVGVVFDRFIAEAIGIWFGLKSTVKKAPPNAILESAFKQKKAPSSEIIESLSKQTDLTRRQVERWFRVRRNQERTPVLKKFKESAWRGLYYFIIFWYGLYVHLDKSWFYVTQDCWQGWPSHSSVRTSPMFSHDRHTRHPPQMQVPRPPNVIAQRDVNSLDPRISDKQPIDEGVFWYYHVQLGFYISLLYGLFTETKRKDFTEMIVHHVATVLLLSLSWVNNFVRIGTLILLVHDAVDSWMEAAKVFKYIGYEKLCEGFFFTFMVVWVITRMIIFPFRIIYSTMFEALPIMGGEDMPYFSMYTVYNALLCILQVLHIIWFYYICLIARDAFKGEQMQDSRSSMESASDPGPEDQVRKEEKDQHNHLSNDVKGSKAGTNGFVQRKNNKKTS